MVGYKWMLWDNATICDLKHAMLRDGSYVMQCRRSDYSGVTFRNNTFMMVGDKGNIWRSTGNGSSWDNVTRTIPENDGRTWNVGFQE